MKQLLIFLAVMHCYIQTCSKGCLSCTPEDKCKICDLSEHYFLDENGVCVESELENCEMIDPENLCLQCEKGFYYDKV